MVKKLSMFLFTVLLLGLLAGCGLNEDNVIKSSESNPSSLSSVKTSEKPVYETPLPKASENRPDINTASEKPVTETPLPEASENPPGSNIESAESKKHVDDTLKMLEELDNDLSSLDTVQDQDLITQ